MSKHNHKDEEGTYYSDCKECMSNLKTESKKPTYWDYFDEWDGWSCHECGELLPSDERDLVEHLKEKHNIEVEF